MRILINKDKLSDIENAFTRLKANDSDIAAQRTIADALKSITGKAFSVDTVKPTSMNQSCVIMSIYPSESVINKIIEAIVSENTDDEITNIWNGSDSWNVEIDSRILTAKAGLTERELTALLMHEIGHFVYSNSVPVKINRVIKIEFAKNDLISKYALKNSMLNKLLYFPLLNLCGGKKDKDTLRNEIRADNYAVKAGYGMELNSAIDKIVGYIGTTDVDKDTIELMGFSIDTLKQLEKRQNNIVRRNIAHMVASTPSKIAGKLFNKVSTGLGNNGVNESRNDEYINSILEDSAKYVTEGFFSRVNKLKRIDPASIDYIGLEIGNIRNNDDKMLVLSLIYNKLDTVNYYINILDSKNNRYIVPHSRESLINMKNLLNKYREMVLSRPLPEIKYGLTIQYPEGYEG